MVSIKIHRSDIFTAQLQILYISRHLELFWKVENSRIDKTGDLILFTVMGSYCLISEVTPPTVKRLMANYTL